MHIALIIFALTYIIIGIQNIPKLHINRPAGALLGAVAMVLFGVISLKEAYAAIDLDTILFILGMMIIVAYTEVSGFFQIAEDFILKSAENGAEKIKVQKELLIVSFVALALLLVFLSLGFSPPAVAITLACFFILAGAAKPRKALEEVDWTLLLFFAGLFIVMKGVEKSGIISSIFNYVQHYLSDGKLKQIVNLSLGSTAISNIISNVPAVIIFSHFFANLANSKLAWLTLAMSSTLAGSLTIIGSVANIIVFESARDEAKVGFFEYLKVGLPLTLITLALGVIVLFVLT